VKKSRFRLSNGKAGVSEKAAGAIEPSDVELDLNVSTEELELLVGNRLAGETDRAVVACNDYLRMGPGRTLTALRNYYESVAIVDSASDLPRPAPSTSLHTLRNWSMTYGWGMRAETFDAQVEGSKTEWMKEVLATGLAVPANRVLSLRKLAARLESEIETRLWGRDWRKLGKGDIREFLRVNGPLLTQYRGVLDDIALETGGRRKSMELTGADGGPIDITDSSRALLFSRLLSGPADEDEEGTSGDVDE
jgi:hypothetical protein